MLHILHIEKEANIEEEVKVDKEESLAEKIADLSLSEKNDIKKKEFSEEEKLAIKAEREAKKAAKANKKAASKEGKAETAGGESVAKDIKEKAEDAKPGTEGEGEKTKAQLKAERKAQFELQQKLKAPADSGPGEKSKAELKAERRAKQEAQRKAKAEAEEKKVEQKKAPTEEKKSEKKKEKKAPAGPSPPERKKTQRQVGLFSHLHQYERQESASKKVPLVGGNIHPAIITLGLQHADGQVVGSSGRCTSLLLALKSVLLDSLPLLFSSEELYKDVDNLIKTNVTFLRQVPTTRSTLYNNLY